jgi:DNA end-binding protein Ku
MSARNVKDTVLSFGMVSVPVGLRKIEKAETAPAPWKMASPSGHAVKQTYVDVETGELVGTSADCLRGVFDDPKNGVGFHEVAEDARKAVDEAGMIDGIVLDGFIPASDVPTERYQDAYFVAPNAKSGGAVAAKSLVLLRDALSATGMVGIGKLTLRSKQRPFVVYAQDGGLILNLLAFAEDFAQIVEAAEVFAGVEADPKQVALAQTLVTSMALSRDDLDAFVDTTRAAKQDLLDQALAGKTVVAAVETVTADPITDLEAMLVASIGAVEPKSKPKKAAAKAA